MLNRATKLGLAAFALAGAQTANAAFVVSYASVSGPGSAGQLASGSEQSGDAGFDGFRQTAASYLGAQAFAIASLPAASVAGRTDTWGTPFAGGFSAGIYDTISFTVPNALPTDVTTISAHVRYAIEVQGGGVAQMVASVGGGSALSANIQRDSAGLRIVGGHNTANGGYASFGQNFPVETLPGGCRGLIDFMIPIVMHGSFAQFPFSLEASGYDFGNTVLRFDGSISFVIPRGMTLSSQSGLAFTGVQIPEPAMMGLFCLGLMGLVVMRKRQSGRVSR